MIKAIIFDLDNTLIDRQKAFKEMLERKFHILFDDEELIQKMINDILKWDNNGTVERIEQLELPIIKEPRTLIRIKKNEKTKEKYPREFKQISKKPL